MNRRSFLAGLLGSTAAVALPLPAAANYGWHREVMTVAFTDTPTLRFAYVGSWGASVPKAQVFGSIAAAIDAIDEGGTVMVAPGHTESGGITIDKPMTLIGAQFESAHAKPA